MLILQLTWVCPEITWWAQSHLRLACWPNWVSLVVVLVAATIFYCALKCSLLLDLHFILQLVCTCTTIAWRAQSHLRWACWPTWVSLVVVWFAVTFFFCVLKCSLMLHLHFHSTAGLWLYNNSLTGTITSKIGLLTKLSKSCCCLVATTFFYCALKCSLMLHLYFHSTDGLFLYNNSFTGEFTCRNFITYCKVSCDDYSNDACHSLWESSSWCDCKHICLHGYSFIIHGYILLSVVAFVEPFSHS